VPSPLAAERFRPTSAACRRHQTHSATGDPAGPLQGKGIILREAQCPTAPSLGSVLHGLEAECLAAIRQLERLRAHAHAVQLDAEACPRPDSDNLVSGAHAAARDGSAGAGADGQQDYGRRRDTVRGALADTRGARGRARAVRDAARDGAEISEAVLAGLRPVHAGQIELFGY